MSTNAPTPRISLHQLSLYNTGRMTPEQVVAAFAARREQFERIVAEVAKEKPKSRAQHHLIVGQRGMGKTMLLARIAAELRTDAALAARFVPLVFAEEQYAVDRLSKFWLNCLDSLADARELDKDTKSVQDIDATVTRLTAPGTRAAKDDQPYADEVYEAFAKAAKVGGQRPVLLVDNLQLVFERLEKNQQHSLRELLMRPGSPILVGASPSPPPQTQDYGAAFYDHFKVHYLRPLDEVEMRELLLHLAAAAERDDVRQRVVQHPARLTVLRQLTGGNPRTTLTLFFLYAEDFAPSVFGDLEGLLDRVTPLYKARFEELTPQQQVVASAVANHWDPVTAASLATATNLPASTISAQIDRLEKTGVVERVEMFDETRASEARTGYQLAERFFNIWFLMRSASRRQRREVEFLTKFLESFYEPKDRHLLARQLMSEEHFSPDRYLWSRAVAASLTEPEAAEELKRHAELSILSDRARDARAQLHGLVEFETLPLATRTFDELRTSLMALVSKKAGITPESFAKSVLGDRRLFMSAEREQLAGRVEPLSPEEVQSVLDSIDASRAADDLEYGPQAVAWFTQRLASGQIRSLHDAEDWNRAFHKADVPDSMHLMLDTLPDDFGPSITDASVARIRSTRASTARGLVGLPHYWAYYLHRKLARYDEARIAYKETIATLPQYGWAWINLGELLAVQFHEYAQSADAYREAIKLSYEPEVAWAQLGNLLQNHLGAYEEAAEAHRAALNYNPENSIAWNSLGNLYCDYLGRLDDAEAAFNEAVRLDPISEAPIQNRIFLHRDFMGEGPNARSLMTELQDQDSPLWPDTSLLHEALFEAYDSNWGLACEPLSKALDLRADGFASSNTDDWLRASAVLIHLNYGSAFLKLLDERGESTKLRPWVEALRAHEVGDRRVLQNIAPEIRTTAEVFYDNIEMRLTKLPKHTNRRGLSGVTRSRSKRK